MRFTLVRSTRTSAALVERSRSIRTAFLRHVTRADFTNACRVMLARPTDLSLNPVNLQTFGSLNLSSIERHDIRLIIVRVYALVFLGFQFDFRVVLVLAFRAVRTRAA